MMFLEEPVHDNARRRWRIGDLTASMKIVGIRSDMGMPLTNEMVRVGRLECSAALIKPSSVKFE